MASKGRTKVIYKGTFISKQSLNDNTHNVLFIENLTKRSSNTLLYLRLVRISMNKTLFPTLHAFWILDKTVIRKNCVGGSVLNIEPTQNSPTNAYISRKPRKWKPR